MRTATICPTCAIFENALCVLYNGAYLPCLDISPLDSMEVILQKINDAITNGCASTTTTTTVEPTTTTTTTDPYATTTTSTTPVPTTSTTTTSAGTTTTTTTIENNYTIVGTEVLSDATDKLFSVSNFAGHAVSNMIMNVCGVENLQILTSDVNVSGTLIITCIGPIGAGSPTVSITDANSSTQSLPYTGGGNYTFNTVTLNNIVPSTVTFYGGESCP